MRTVILGTGPLGMAVMEAERAKGHEVLMVNRAGLVREHLPEGVRVIKGDLDAHADLAEQLGKLDLVFNCTGLPEPWTFESLAKLQDGAVELARTHGAYLIQADHMFAYGNAKGIPISEASPERADAGYAGPVYKNLRTRLLDHHYAGTARVVLARSPLAYGPRITQGPLGKQVFARLIDRQEAVMLGSLDYPHSFGYIRDMGKNMSLLAEHPEAAGQVWHLPSSPAITQQQILDILRDMLSRNAYARLINRPRGLSGLFSKEHLAWETILYQFEGPFVSNHTKFSTTFGERCTPHTQALWETLEWYRRHGMGL